jgi:hypothetical protein
MSTQNKLTRDDLYSLEKYTEIRNEFRRKVMAHKENRRLELGDNLVLLFEDKLIMQYQVQEMLKAERIFETEGINEELEAYNPLIPDGHNWKCTMMIQYTDIDTRRVMLGKLIGIEDVVWMQVEGHDKIYPFADEDLERDTADKTSAVHFLRYELTPDMIKSARAGSAINAGVEHENYAVTLSPVPQNIAASLVADLD